MGATVTWLDTPVNLSTLVTPSMTLVDISAYVPETAKGAIVRAKGGSARSYRFAYKKYGATGTLTAADHEVGSYSWHVVPIHPAQYVYMGEDNYFGGLVLEGWVTHYEGVDDISKITGLSVSVFNNVNLAARCPDAVAIQFWVEDNNGWNYYVRPDGSTSTILTGPSFHRSPICKSPSQIVEINPVSFGGSQQQEFHPIGYFTSEAGQWLTNFSEISLSLTGSWEDVDISGVIADAKAVFLTYEANGAYAVAARAPGAGTSYVCTQNFGGIIVEAINGHIEIYRSNSNCKFHIVGWLGDSYANDRIYVYLGTYANPLLHELTAPANTGIRGVLGARTEIGWDEELQKASAGVCQLTVDNHNGDYSPENPAGEYYGDLELGAYIKVFEIYHNVQYNHFFGRIDSIVPHAEKDNQVAFILAVDGMDDLAQLEINTSLRQNTNAGVLAGDVLDAAGWPAGARDLDTGSDTLQLGWFHKTDALSAMRLLEAIENGRFFIDSEGNAVFENRHARLLGDGLISQGDFEDTMAEIAYEWSKRLVYNQATVRGRRYYITGAMLWSGYDLAEIDSALIWSAHAGDTGAPYIPQGTSMTLWAEFNVPLASYDTLVAGTHWNANTVFDKSGVDVTANFSLVQTQYGQSVKLVFTNNGSQGAYLVEPDSPPLGAPADRTVLVYGVLYAEEVMAIMEEDATSQAAYGKRSLEIDAKFKSNPNDIRSYAEYLVHKYKDPVPRAANVKFIARRAWPDDTIRVACLARFISDRITLKSTLLGFDTDYFINKVVQEYTFQEGGMIHETTWSVERCEGAYEGVFWILGVTGYSEIGETTWLGF